MKQLIHPCIVPSQKPGQHELAAWASKYLRSSKIAEHFGGSYVQQNIGFGGIPEDPHLFRRDAETILSKIPNYPEHGFRRMSGDLVRDVEDIAGAFLCYEPGQGIPGEPTASNRFDTAIRPGLYTHDEINLVGRLLHAIRLTGWFHHQTHLDVGFYNTPSGLGDRANVPALHQLHMLARTDFVFANCNETTGTVWGDWGMVVRRVTLRRQQFAPMGAHAPRVMPFLSPRDNSQDTTDADGADKFKKLWVDKHCMRAKGAAVKHLGTPAVLWINAEWFLEDESVDGVTEALDGLAEGLA